MDKHVTIVGALYLVFSLMGILGAAVVFFAVAGGGLLSGDASAIAITAGVGGAIAIFLLVLSLPGLLAGIGLLRRYSWGRTLGIIVAVLNLINIPFGTILGIYALWVLVQDDTARLFAH